MTHRRDGISETKLPGKGAPYLHPYAAGTVLGIVLFLSFFISGHGLGASGGVQRVTAAALDIVASDHVDRTPQWAAVAGGSRNPLDHWIVWGVAGVFLGGLASGLLAGRVRVETNGGPRLSPRQRWVLALIGGLLVGFAARLARGCTSGQALSGGAVLATGSWVFMVMVFAGGYALAWPLRRLWN